MAITSAELICRAFSTANAGAASPSAGTAQVQMLSNDKISRLFGATILATEEAIINVLVAAESMTGRDGNKVDAIPHDQLRQVMRKYNRLIEAQKK